MCGVNFYLGPLQRFASCPHFYTHDFANKLICNPPRSEHEKLEDDIDVLLSTLFLLSNLVHIFGFILRRLRSKIGGYA